MADQNELDAAIAAITGASASLAQTIERAQSRLPFFVTQHSSQQPSTSPFTITLQPLSNQLVRVLGIFANFPDTSLTLARVTVGSLIIDLPITSAGAGIIIDGPEIVKFLRQSDPLTFEVTGSSFSSQTNYATFWVWGEQVPTTGMIT